MKRLLSTVVFLYICLCLAGGIRIVIATSQPLAAVPTTVLWVAHLPISFIQSQYGHKEAQYDMATVYCFLGSKEKANKLFKESCDNNYSKSCDLGCK